MIYVLVTDGKIETDRVIIFFHFVPYYFFNSLAEGAFGILHICETTHDERAYLVEFTCAFQVKQHTVRIIEVLTYVFNEKDLTSCIHFGEGACKMGQYCEVATGEHCFCGSLPVE